MMKNYFTTIVWLCILSVTGYSQVPAKVKYVQHKMAPTAQAYNTMTFDGAWCWFSDPRAVYHEGKFKRTYVGWIDGSGDIFIGYYDHETKEIKHHLVYESHQVDDHNNPSILFDAQGHILFFFNYHGTSRPLMMTRSVLAEDISAWESISNLPLNDTATYRGLWNTYTYTNPIRLSGENDRLYLFWRGIDNKPNYSLSDDNGRNWTMGKIFILPERKYANRRPYLKVYSNDKDRIHFAFTDGHPRNEKLNSIYYMRYQNGYFLKANGDTIKKMGEPVDQHDVDMVYDASISGEKAWVWDIAEDKNGYPVILYAKFPSDSDHLYCYARWDGKAWKNYTLIHSGSWFPETLAGWKESEPNYSGGMNIDKEDPNTIYLSVNRNGKFEIEKWITADNGKNWKAEAITAGSDRNNIRPFAVRGATKGNPLQVLWMYNSQYGNFSDYYKHRNPLMSYHASIKLPFLYEPFDAALSKKSVLNILKTVSDWTFQHLYGKTYPNKIDWIYAPFWDGVSSLYNYTKDENYLNAMINTGQEYDWKVMNDVYNADRLAIGQMYLDLARITGNHEYSKNIEWVLDMHLARHAMADVRFTNNPYRNEWWSWCDALFMAPATFVKAAALSGNKKYLDYMNRNWWKTSDYLYSKTDSLFYRDDSFFAKKSPNGSRVFWGRGNGWVLAGLAMVLNDLPRDYETRSLFEAQFREMATKLKSLQNADGMWTSNLLDSGSQPQGESSATALITYGLAWGINNGILDKSTYGKCIESAWSGLCHNVDSYGKLGYVQRVSDSPGAFGKDDTQVYASGAFLMAGCEMLRYLKN